MSWLCAFSLCTPILAGSLCQSLYALIIDPYYATGTKLADAVKALPGGVIPIAVLSQPKAPTLAKLHGSDFPDLPVVHRRSVGKTAAAIRAILGHDGQVVAVVAAVDRGVPLADKLAKRFKVPGNDPNSSAARHDKVAIDRSLRKAGVPLPETFVVRSMDDAELRKIDRSPSWPFYVQPPASSGSDGSRLVHNPNELREAVSAILGKANQLRAINREVVVRQYISGEQYAVNGVRYIDPHTGHVVSRITGIWHQVREGDGGEFPPHVYGHNVLLPSDGDLQNLLVTTNEKVIDAQDLKVGFFHVEYRVRKKGKAVEAVPIDPNSRPAGAGMPVLEGIATGTNPLGMGLQAQAAPQALMGVPSRYALREPVAVIYIRTHGNARLSKRMEPELKRMKESGELIDYEYEFEDGAALEPTKDSDTIVGKIISSNPDDIKKFRDWEREGRFEERNS